MRYRLAWTLLGLFASGCQHRDDDEPPATAYVRFSDRISAAFPGLRPIIGKPCYNWTLPVDQCRKFLAPRRYKGIWVRVNGWSFLYPKAHRPPSGLQSHDQGPHFPVRTPGQMERLPADAFGTRYEASYVEFVGRPMAYTWIWGDFLLIDRITAFRVMERRATPPPGWPTIDEILSRIKR